MDIYHRQQQAVGGIFTTDRAVAAISSGNGSSSWVSALVQNVQAEYMQDFQEMYEIGSSNTYRVLGRPKGRMTIGRIIGATGAQALDDALYDACNSGGTMTITATPSMCAAQPGSVKMVFSGLFVVSYGISIAVGDQMIRENVSLAFTNFNRILQ